MSGEAYRLFTIINETIDAQMKTAGIEGTKPIVMAAFDPKCDKITVTLTMTDKASNAWTDQNRISALSTALRTAVGEEIEVRIGNSL